MLEADPALLTHALINLCLNSVDAMRCDAMRGVGTLTSVRAVPPDGPASQVAVIDTSAGVTSRAKATPAKRSSWSTRIRSRSTSCFRT